MIYILRSLRKEKCRIFFCCSMFVPTGRCDRLSHSRRLSSSVRRGSTGERLFARNSCRESTVSPGSTSASPPVATKWDRQIPTNCWEIFLDLKIADMTVNVDYVLYVFWTLLELETEVLLMEDHQIYIYVLGGKDRVIWPMIYLNVSTTKFQMWVVLAPNNIAKVKGVFCNLLVDLGPASSNDWRSLLQCNLPENRQTYV